MGDSINKQKKRLKQVRFSLLISSNAYQAYYRGDAKYIQVTTDQLLKVKMPADIFKRFVTHQGIAGSFVVTYDQDKRFQSIEKLK